MWVSAITRAGEKSKWKSDSTEKNSIQNLQSKWTELKEDIRILTETCNVSVWPSKVISDSNNGVCVCVCVCCISGLRGASGYKLISASRIEKSAVRPKNWTRFCFYKSWVSCRPRLMRACGQIFKLKVPSGTENGSSEWCHTEEPFLVPQRTSQTRVLQRPISLKSSSKVSQRTFKTWFFRDPFP